ncbi:enterobactin synthetase component D [Rhodanobacter sp. ANJX3]|uniref:4'-phosphopantetheinyl transferase family protein n=1 Tax=Rhodanobacter sp. ANJX3 TaxID=2723083 RepID=UPI0016175CB4|nr:4'-phosphopantetheinyl transferase superfamily protein [Rhodanobacter sp. ANJX3]MBB5359997.1 enterobactin synthetase component D [Rhodanobacter sp. ANJX3]
MTIDAVSGMRRVAFENFPVSIPPAFVLPFDATHTEANFDEYGIACPLSVLRSLPKRQAEYLAGRRAAIAALREQGSSALDLPIGPRRAPAWPLGYTGSISHTSSIAVAVAMRTCRVQGVGIDIEHIVTPAALEALLATAIDATELAPLTTIARRLGWAFALTLAFSAKESFYKATAATVGRFFDFSAVRIVDCGIGGSELKVEVTQPLAENIPSGMKFAVGYVQMDQYTILTSCAW